MLRINLLPIRLYKKRAKAKKQLMGMVLLFLILLAACAGVNFLQASKIEALDNDIAALNREKDSYRSTLNKINKYKKDMKELDRKTSVIKQLKKDSSLTVRVLDEVANRIDNQRVWLESLQQQNNSLQMNGVALDNQTVAQLMEKLKESPYIREVTLTNTSQKMVFNKNLKSFSLSCAVAHPEPPPEEGKDAKK